MTRNTTEAVDLETERKTEQIHEALSGTILHGWEMSRRDFVYITLTHDSGRKVRVYYSSDDDVWMLMAGGERLFAYDNADTIDKAITLMSRIGREVSN